MAKKEKEAPKKVEKVEKKVEPVKSGFNPDIPENKQREYR